MAISRKSSPNFISWLNALRKPDQVSANSTPHEAQERAEREFRAESCVGADAYMVIENSSSGEVGDLAFLVRLGSVPEQE